MKYKTENNLYFRTFQDISDSLLMQCSINKNKKSLEKLFFDNGMICSWAAKNSSDFKGDFIYCKGIGENSTDISKVNYLFSKMTDNFQFPEYEDYEHFVQASANSMNISKKIINKLTGNVTKKLDKEKFNDELKRFLANITTSFTETSNLIKIKNKKNHHMQDVLDNVTEGSLSFMGCCQLADAYDIKSMVIYKILEKYYGCGETDTIYNYYRSNGETYIACSGYSSDDNIFYTGILSSYSNDIFNDVTSRIRSLVLNNHLLNTVKKRFIDDLCFSCFQFGEQLTVMPYIIHTGYKITVNDIIQIVQSIDTNNIISATSQKKYLLKVVMQ